METNDGSTTNSEQESFVACQNSQGLGLQASLLRFTRHVAVFEVYSQAVVLRMSEVLTDFKIVLNDRPVYAGRAVISNLVPTGTVLVCEAALQEEGWVDVNLFSLASQQKELRAGFEGFFRQWEKIYKVRPDYKVVIADLQTFMSDLRLWLEQVELGIRSLPSTDRLQAERDVVEELQPSTTAALGHFFEKFEVTARGIDDGLGPVHGAFCRRQLHPLLMSSPFMHRIYVKPLGYAGDYEMVNMILRDPCEGGSLFAKLLNVFILSQVPATAHRNRVTYLTERLIEETLRVARLGRTLRVLNLGCGPAKEVQNFLTDHQVSEQAQFELIDFDEETLMHTGQVLDRIKSKHQRRTPVKLVRKSVHQILKQVGKPRQESQEYDFIYCAGLFDYLSNRTCKSLLNYFYDFLAPGGLLVATNVEGQNPIRNIMEYMFEWHLIYRSSKEFGALAPDRAPADGVSLKTEGSGGNIFLEARKPSLNS
jgi:extracellular factor (EF) 3-hydroxypalmitic acid methyl ester biosynthesis protein